MVSPVEALQWTVVAVAAMFALSFVIVLVFSVLSYLRGVVEEWRRM